jgi:hypothetical protein
MGKRTATQTEQPSAFALSRIQAEGWSAAQKYLPSNDAGDKKKIATLNPHSGGEERARWFAGFENARDKF